MKVPLRRFATVALLVPLASSVANAGSCGPISFGPSQPSADRAVTATLQELVRASGRYESGGFVIEQDGMFRSSKPVTQRSRNAVNYCIVLPRGATLAAIYHTHVGNPQFSAQDRRNAERAGVPSYVATIHGAQLFAYDPTQKQARVLDMSPPRAGHERALPAGARWPEPLLTLLRRLAAVFRS